MPKHPFHSLRVFGTRPWGDWKIKLQHLGDVPKPQSKATVGNVCQDWLERSCCHLYKKSLAPAAIAFTITSLFIIVFACSAVRVSVWEKVEVCITNVIKYLLLLWIWNQIELLEGMVLVSYFYDYSCICLKNIGKNIIYVAFLLILENIATPPIFFLAFQVPLDIHSFNTLVSSYFWPTKFCKTICKNIY